MNSTFSEIELEKIKLGFTEVLSNDLLETMISFDEIADDFIRNRCRLMIQGHLWGESGTPQTITYPATWWDAVKERWFPKWLLTRYPVSYRIHEITLKTLYPNFRISMPRETHVLKYIIASHTETR